MRAQWIGAALAAICLQGAFAASAARETAIPLSLYLDRLTAMQATVNGRTGTYFFDTGGGITIISPATAAAGGCTPWANIAGFRMNGERLDAPRCDNVTVTTPGGAFKATHVMVFDVTKLLPPGAPPVEGLIGLDLLAGKTVTLQSRVKTLVLETPQSLKARLKSAREVPIRAVRDAQGLSLTYDIGVPTAKGLAWMEIDSGNISGTMMVSTWVAPLFGLDPANKEPQDISGEILPGVKLPPKARVVPNMIMDGLIGAEFLKDWDLTIDTAAGRAWLSPAQ